MKLIICALLLSPLALPALSLPQPNGCTNFEEVAKKYIEDNYPAEDGQPAPTNYRIERLTYHVAIIHLKVNGETETRGEPANPQLFTLFFAGKNACELVYQADGELTEIIEAGPTKYGFVKTEDNTAEEHHANYQIVTIRANGEVGGTHDQHGQEIYFSDSIQKRCEGKVGDITYFTLDNRDKSRATLRLQHTDRDGKCRVTEDSSTYRYYKLTAERWELDEGEAEAPVTAGKSR